VSNLLRSSPGRSFPNSFRSKLSNPPSMVNSKPNWRHRIPKVIEHQNSISSFEMNGREKSGFPGDTANDEASGSFESGAAWSGIDAVRDSNRSTPVPR
jgi:hypothetical protein